MVCQRLGLTRERWVYLQVLMLKALLPDRADWLCRVRYCAWRSKQPWPVGDKGVHAQLAMSGDESRRDMKELS